MVPFVDRQILDAAIVPEFPDRDAAIGQIEALLHVNQAKWRMGFQMSILRSGHLRLRSLFIC